MITTSKSNHKRQAIIPLYDELRDVLARIPKRSTTVLTNSLGRPWTTGGFGASFHRAKIAAGIGDLHFHDLRGTAATRFYVAGLPERVIAEIIGWQEESVAKIVHRYVDRTAAQRDHPATRSAYRVVQKENKAWKTRCKTVIENSD